MPNTYAGSVIRVDTTAAFDYARRICGIKFIPVADGSCTIRKTDGSGSSLWEHSSGDGDPSPLEPIFEAVEFISPTGVHVTVSSGSVVYLYLE